MSTSTSADSLKRKRMSDTEADKKYHNPQRILVTGGAGFLGSHLCERLVLEGHDVICLDNFFTSQKDNIRHLLQYNNFELIRHDVTEPILIEVDKIYNLACPASPVHYQYNPIKTMKTSWLGAMHMLGCAKRCRARILQTSTSEVPPTELSIVCTPSVSTYCITEFGFTFVSPVYCTLLWSS